MKKNLKEIVSELRLLLPQIEQKYNVRSLEIFGSFAKKIQTEKSDLDLMVTFTRTPSLLKFIELQNFLSDQLELKIDLVMKDSLKPSIEKTVLQESITV